MADLADHRSSAFRWRPVLRVWHRWFGLAAALWLFLLAATGVAIVFYDEGDRFLNPDLRTISGHSSGPPDVDAAVAQARASLPGFHPRFIDLPNAPGDSLLLMGSAPRNGADAEEVQVFADPRNGAILGWRFGHTFSFDRRYLMDTLYALHVDLMLEEVGVWFIGLVALLWLVDHFAAAVLAVPRLEKWRAAFAVGAGAGLRRLFDLHRAPGLWIFPVTFVLALSGLVLTWYGESRAVVSMFSPVGGRLHEQFPDEAVDTVQVSANQALATVGAQTGQPADSILVFPGKGVYGVRSFDDRDMDGYGRLWTYVAMSDGAVRGQRHDVGESAGDLFFVWQYALHSGKGFGLPGRLLILAAGLVTMLLCVTGVWLWWRRRR